MMKNIIFCIVIILIVVVCTIIGFMPKKQSISLPKEDSADDFTPRVLIKDIKIDVSDDSYCLEFPTSKLCI